MSAFVVSKKHVDALLTFARRPEWGSDTYYRHNGGAPVYFVADNLDAIGQALVNQNYASVNYRYSELEIPPEYKFERYPLPLSAVQVIKACDCYNYQACETDNYYTTEAHSIINQIRERAIDELPGYDEAAWEID